MRKPQTMTVDEYKRAAGIQVTNCDPQPIKAKARPRHTPGEMNSLEKRMADELQLQLAGGHIAHWAFEAVKLRLAKATFYTPDFMVIHTCGAIEFRETKGFWQDDARVKIKMAAEIFWWASFTAYKPEAKKRGGGWNVETF